MKPVIPPITENAAYKIAFDRAVIFAHSAAISAALAQNLRVSLKTVFEGYTDFYWNLHTSQEKRVIKALAALALEKIKASDLYTPSGQGAVGESDFSSGDES